MRHLSSATPTIRWIGNRLIAIVISRSVVAVSTTCAILYAGLWIVGMLQTNGIISTSLPISVADEVILRRSGALLGQAAPSPSELQQRQKALASAQRAEAAPAGDGSGVTLEVQTSPPVELWVLDGSDQATGVSPETQLVRLQLPGSAYSGKGSDPQLVSIPHASGRYRIQLWTTQNTHFELRVRAFANGQVDNATEYAGQGEVFQNSVLQSVVSIAADADASAPSLDVGPAVVMLAPGLAAAPGAPQPESQVEAAQAEPSTAASPSTQPSPDDAAVVAGPVATAVPSAGGGTAVFRPQPQPALPIPLPVGPLPVAAEIHQD